MISRLQSLSALFSFAVLTASSWSQQKSAENLRAAAIAPDPIIILDTVVTEQWPSTLLAVNAPTNMLRITPGQCVRLGVAAYGKGHEHFLDGITIGYTVESKAAEQAFPLATAAATKLIKPEGGDFVTGALAAANIKNPLETMTALAASAGKWCAPPVTQDESVEVHATVKLSGKEAKLNAIKIQVESLETSGKKPFADIAALSTWMMGYHIDPEPGRLLAAVDCFAAKGKGEANVLEFFQTALRHDAATVEGFGPLLPRYNKLSRMLFLALLSKAGIALTELPPLTDEDRVSIATVPDLRNRTT